MGQAQSSSSSEGRAAEDAPDKHRPPGLPHLIPNCFSSQGEAEKEPLVPSGPSAPAGMLCPGDAEVTRGQRSRCSLHSAEAAFLGIQRLERENTLHFAADRAAEHKHTRREMGFCMLVFLPAKKSKWIITNNNVTLARNSC